MVAVTYGVTRFPATKTPSARKPLRRAKPSSPGIDALVESTSAACPPRDLKACASAPHMLDERGNRLFNTADKMPFSG